MSPHLRQRITHRTLTAACILAIPIAWSIGHTTGWARHPHWYAAYAKARLLHPTPGLPDDGEISRDEFRVFCGIIRGWYQHTERTPT